VVEEVVEEEVEEVVEDYLTGWRPHLGCLTQSRIHTPTHPLILPRIYVEV